MAGQVENKGLVERVRELMEDGKIQADASPKEVLLKLHKKGEVSTPAVRAMAKLLDEKIAEGKLKDPLTSVLKAFDRGEVKVKSAGPKTEKTATLADVPDGASSKEKILYLFRHGAIAESTARKAAAALDAQQEAGDALDVALALYAAGAGHLLPEKVQKALQEADEAEAEASAPQDPDSDGDEGETGDDGADGGQAMTTTYAAAQAEKLKALVFGSTVDELEPKIRAMTDVEKLKDLKKVEQTNPEFENGRKGVLDVIEERIGELETASTGE